MDFSVYIRFASLRHHRREDHESAVPIDEVISGTSVREDFLISAPIPFHSLQAFRPIPLEGSIEGNALKIRLRVPAATGGELLVNYIATLEGDELKFTYQSETGRPSPPFGPAAREFAAKRVK